MVSIKNPNQRKTNKRVKLFQIWTLACLKLSLADSGSRKKTQRQAWFTNERRRSQSILRGTRREASEKKQLPKESIPLPSPLELRYIYLIRIAPALSPFARTRKLHLAPYKFSFYKVYHWTLQLRSRASFFYFTPKYPFSQRLP